MNKEYSIDQSPDKPIILCFIGYYLPGNCSGGPVRSISNLVDSLGDYYRFKIVTRDRDVLDKEPYDGITINSWNRVGKAEVFYASDNILSLFNVYKIIKKTKHDILYINSIFSVQFAIYPLLANSLVLKNSCIVAPRGECSDGAISIRYIKKQGYLAVAKFLKLFDLVLWQASSVDEVFDIRKRIPNVTPSKITVATDIPTFWQSNQEKITSKLENKKFKLLFLSRISPMKNLTFLLESLRYVLSPISVEIYGPIDDIPYWGKCEQLLRQVPEHIEAKYNGIVESEKVHQVFAMHDLFILPTLGENYGHVIFESLSAGTPVLISDRTPWKSTQDGAIQVLKLDNVQEWAKSINKYAAQSDEERKKARHSAQKYISHYMKNQTSISQHKFLFKMASK